MRVKDIMKSDVVTVRPEATLKEVAELLVKHGISGLPVVDDTGEVVGVVSEADILYKEQSHTTRRSIFSWMLDDEGHAVDRKLAARTAGEAMTSPAITTPRWRSTAEAARTMLESEVNRLPVVDKGKLIGIVTRADLVRAFVRTDEEIANEIRVDILGQALMLSDPEAVDVTVKGGEVALDGSVDRRYEAEVAAIAVAKVPGVVSVESTLTWRQ